MEPKPEKNNRLSLEDLFRKKGVKVTVVTNEDLSIEIYGQRVPKIDEPEE